jgi:hypothetical protein
VICAFKESCSPYRICRLFFWTCSLHAMSLYSNMDIPAALRTLRNAPLEALQQHSTDTVSTFEELQYRLRNLNQNEESEVTDSPACCVCRRTISRMTDKEGAPNTSLMPHTSAVSDQRLLNKPRHVDDITMGSGKSKPPAKPPAKSHPIVLFEALTAELPKAQEFTTKNKPLQLYLNLQKLQSDRRLNDILRVEGNSNPTFVDKLLRGAAQRSLAMQYSDYQRGEGKTTRVDELCDLLSGQNADGEGKLRTGRGGGIMQWVKDELQYEKEKQNIVITCVNCGIKQLVVEGLFRKRLLPSAKTLEASGISVLTALTMTLFKKLRLEEIPPFLDQVFAVPSSNENIPVAAPRHPPCKFLDAIHTLSRWFGEFLWNYHSKRPAFDEDVSNAYLVDLSVLSQEFDLPRSLHSHHSSPEPSSECTSDADPPSFTNSDDNSNTAQPYTSATACDRLSGDIDVISSTSSKPGKDYSSSPLSSYQTSIPHERSLSGDSLNEQVSARDYPMEDSLPATPRVDCASICYLTGRCVYPNLDSFAIWAFFSGILLILVEHFLTRTHNSCYE